MWKITNLKTKPSEHVQFLQNKNLKNDISRKEKLKNDNSGKEPFRKRTLLKRGTLKKDSSGKE